MIYIVVKHVECEDIKIIYQTRNFEAAVNYMTLDFKEFCEKHMIDYTFNCNEAIDYEGYCFDDRASVYSDSINCNWNVLSVSTGNSIKGV